MSRVLVASDKFKGSPTASEVAVAVGAGVRRVRPDAEISCGVHDGACPDPAECRGSCAVSAGRRSAWTSQRQIVESPWNTERSTGATERS